MLKIRYSSLFLFSAILFWIYACFFYPFFNYANFFQVENRVILCILIFACIGLSLCLKEQRWLGNLYDPVGLSIFLYLFYIFISFGLSILFDNIPVKHIASFVIHCFLPILFYFAFKNYKGWEKIFYTIVIVLLFNALVAISTSPLTEFDIPLFNQLAKQGALEGGSGPRLKAFIGNPTILGYFALICIATYLAFPSLRFKHIVLPVMVVTALLARSRGVWAGLLILLLLFICFTAIIRTHRKNILPLLLFIPILGIVVYLFFNYYTNISTVKFLLKNTLEKFNFTDAMSSRAFERIIYNDSNIFFILIGEGFGKYSALIPGSSIQQPDAPYYMIYNETGIIGTIIFFNMIFQIFKYSLTTRNFILLFLVLHLSVGLLGSRYLWYFPINYLFYTFVGMFQNKGARPILPPKIIVK